MLSKTRLDEIIDDTLDAMFVSRWLVARAHWDRQWLEHALKRVYNDLQQRRMDADPQVTDLGSALANAYVPFTRLTDAVSGEDVWRLAPDASSTR
jgi:hypothetical protein